MQSFIQKFLITILFLSSLAPARIYSSEKNTDNDDFSVSLELSTHQLPQTPRLHRPSFLNLAWQSCLFLLASSGGLTGAMANQAGLAGPVLLAGADTKGSALAPFSDPRQGFLQRRLANHHQKLDAQLLAQTNASTPPPSCLLLASPANNATTNATEPTPSLGRLKESRRLGSGLTARGSARHANDIAREPISVQTIDSGYLWKMYNGGVATDEPVQLTYTFSDLMEFLKLDKYPNLRPLEEESRNLVRSALAHISSRSGLTFIEASASEQALANLHFRQADPANDLVGGYAYRITEGSTKTAATYLLGPSQLSKSVIIMHEILHMLGFAHPFDGIYRLPVEGWMDSQWSTVMSYVPNQCRGASDTGPLDDFLLATNYPKPGQARPTTLAAASSPDCRGNQKKTMIIVGSSIAGGIVIAVLAGVAYRHRSHGASAASPGGNGETATGSGPISAASGTPSLQTANQAIEEPLEIVIHIIPAKSA